MFLQYDSGPGSDRFMIFSTENLLNVLRESSTWLIDGTLKICPGVFGQVVSIHGAGFNGENCNCMSGLFALLPNKRTKTYNNFLETVKALLPEANPTSFVCDFEKSLQNAISSTFEDATITGCYFHLAQSHRRQLGSILNDATSSELLRIKKIRTLAFLPEEDVVEAFEELKVAVPPRLTEFVVYFEKNYVRRQNSRGIWVDPRFKISTWNVHDRALNDEIITNNHVEGTHNRLSSYFKADHPNLWLFVDKLREFSRGLEADLVDLNHGKTIKSQNVKWDRLRLQRQTLLRNHNPQRAQAFLTSMAGCIKS